MEFLQVFTIQICGAFAFSIYTEGLESQFSSTRYKFS